MKKLILTAFCFLQILSAKSQEIIDTLKAHISEKQILYEKIVKLKDSTKTPNILYDAAQSWFVSAFKDSKEVLAVQDKQNGRLIGKGTADAGFKIGDYRYTLYYTIEVLLKQGRFKIKMYDIGYAFANSQQPLIAEYESYVSGNMIQDIFESKKGAAKRYLAHLIYADKIVHILMDSITGDLEKSKKEDF
ncbi:MAG TPA: DUF4468 domain-containing protein [Candidatus Babeliaceae bacterium]|nr:DUF4468 domain-containing protein [Candidatus Babeliaceae bacterium]